MKKNRETDLIFYVISDKEATLDAENINIINHATELTYLDENGNPREDVTYQMLRTDRIASTGGSHAGYFRKKDGVEFLIFPTEPMGFTIKEGNVDITEYSYNEFKSVVWDVEEIDEFI